MRLTPKLLGLLNRVFDKDPKAFVALRVRYDGGMTWAIVDGVLTLTVTGGPGASQTYDLANYTIRSLAEDIAGKAGFEVAFIAADRERLSARVLLDASGDQDASNGDALLGYTNLLWAFFEAYAGELQALRDQMDQAPRQMSTTTAEGAWLDEIGSYYGVVRDVGEVDSLYGQRIIAQVLRPMSNNVALERAIEQYTAQQCTVVDVTTYTGGQLYDGSVNFDGTINYDSLSPPEYGLFDVTVAYDLVDGGDLTTFLTTVRGIVEGLRAAGTHLRALALSDAAPLLDSLTAPTDDMGSYEAAAGLSDTLTSPTETTTAWAGVGLPFSEAFTAPTDSASGAILATLTTEGGAPLLDELGNPIQAQVAPLFV